MNLLVSTHAILVVVDSFAYKLLSFAAVCALFVVLICFKKYSFVYGHETKMNSVCVCVCLWRHSSFCWREKRRRTEEGDGYGSTTEQKSYR